MNRFCNLKFNFDSTKGLIDINLKTISLGNDRSEFFNDSGFEFTVNEKWDDFDMAKLIAALHLFVKLYDS